MIRWEYKKLHIKEGWEEGNLNIAGEDGWELMGVVERPNEFIDCYLKRPIPAYPSSMGMGFPQE